MGATFRQYLAALTSALSVAVASSSFNWMEPLMQYFISPDSEIPMTTSDTSWLVSIVELGDLIMTVPAGMIADRFGRKAALLAIGPLMLGPWLVILVTRNLIVLYVMRILHGAGIATAFAVAPMYIAEISEPRIRGELSGHFQTMWYGGTLYGFIVGHYLNYQNYHYALSVPPIIFLALFSLMPESPYYYLMIDNPKAAMKSLKWLRASKMVEEEFKSIQQSVEEDKKSKGGWRDLFATKKDIKFFLIVQTICLIKYLNGMAAIVTYATQTFTKASKGPIMEDEMTIGLGILLFLTPLCAAFVSDSIGRRPLLIYSTLASVVFNIITGTYFFLMQQGYNVSDNYWVVFVSVSAFCIVTNIGLGPLMQTIQAGYFPSHTRALGGGITGVTASIATFVNLKQYQSVIDVAGIHANFWIFAVIGTSGTIFMYFILPETAGKSLGQIQQDMQSKEKVENSEQKNFPKQEDSSTMQ